MASLFAWQKNDKGGVLCYTLRRLCFSVSLRLFFCFSTEKITLFVVLVLNCLFFVNCRQKVYNPVLYL